jgi:hypothetical protein
VCADGDLSGRQQGPYCKLQSAAAGVPKINASLRKAWLTTIVVLATAVAHAAVLTIEPGEYVTAGEFGTLEIKRQGGKLLFDVQTINPIGNVCAMVGEIRNNEGSILRNSKSDEPSCRLRFVRTNAAIELEALNEACKRYCGDNVYFDDVYLNVAPICKSAARAENQKEFQRLYKAKRYEEAEQKLLAVLDECTKISVLAQARMRSDLAITQYHLGKYAKCLKTLKPYAKDIALPADEVFGEEWMGRTDSEAYAGIIHNARTNARLCKAALRKASK